MKNNTNLYEASYEDIRIRPLEKRDIEKLRIWRNDKSKTIFLRPIEEISPEMQEKWFEEYQDNAKEIIFAIEETQKLKRVVGSVALYNFHSDTAEIGKIQIGDEQANGRGIGRKSMVMALLIGFRQFNLKKITACVSPQNIPAYKSDMRIGFQVIGHHSFLDKIEDEIIIDYNRLIEMNSYLSDISIKEYKPTERI